MLPLLNLLAHTHSNTLQAVNFESQSGTKPLLWSPVVSHPYKVSFKGNVTKRNTDAKYHESLERTSVGHNQYITVKLYPNIGKCYLKVQSQIQHLVKVLVFIT